MERVDMIGPILRFALANEHVVGLDDDGWLQLARLGRTVRTMGATCVVLHGNSRTFCEGDVRTEAHPNSDAQARWDRVNRFHAPALRSVVECEVPVVAAVRGIARDEGLALALAADVRLLGHAASFALSDSGNLGAGVGWMLQRRAPSLIGPLLYGPGQVGWQSAACVAAGAYDDSELEEQVMLVARRLSARPEEARARRSALGPVTSESLVVALEFDAELAALCAETPARLTASERSGRD